MLTQSPLDDELRHQCLLLLSKICKARAIIPSSYVLRTEVIRFGRVRYHGGFADVTDGEYLGCPVAIKYLRVNEEGFERVSKVPLITLVHRHRLAFPSGCVKRSSDGSMYPTQTSFLCWELLSPQTHAPSAFSPSGCPTGT